MADIAKVQRNVKRMLDGGAAEPEIEQYLGMEGVTAEQLRAPNLDPAQVPPRNPPVSLGEGIGGTVGEMLNGIPVAGPALLGLAQRGAALKHSLMGDAPYDKALEDVQTRQENFRRDMPMTSQSAGTGGAILGTGMLGSAAPGALGITGRNLATRTLASAASGGTIGGADALARGNDPVTGTAVGAGFGAVAPAAGQMAGAAVRGLMRAPARAAVPALEELRNTSHAAFQVVDNAGATVRPQKMDRIVTDIFDVARKQRINPTLHPDSYAAIQEATTWRGTTPTLSELHQMRQILSDAATAQKPADRRIASMMVEKIDDQIDSLNAFDVAGGDPRASVAALREGMDAWRRMRKGETIAKIFSDAEIDAGAKYTQAGMETALRNGFKRLAKNKKALRGFSLDEVAAIRKVATGGPMENTLRFFGKFAPRGVVSAIPVMAAASYDFGAGAALAGGAEVAKRGATAMTMRNARLADEMIRAGHRPANLPLPKSADAAKRAVQAISLGAPLSLYPSLLDSSARVPR